MNRDPYTRQQLMFDRTPINPNPLEGPFDAQPRCTGDLLVGAFALGGLLGALAVYILERIL